jgi:Protein of unknown function (DUF2442)
MATDKTLIDESSFAKAAEQGRRLLVRGPLAKAAKFVAGRVHVELDNGCAFAFPVAQAEGLTGARAADLRLVEVTAAGLGLYWPSLDADLYVPDLVKGILGTKAWMAHIGAAGGKVASKAKTRAARTNGKLGGRPRKVTDSV